MPAPGDGHSPTTGRKIARGKTLTAKFAKTSREVRKEEQQLRSVTSRTLWLFVALFAVKSACPSHKTLCWFLCTFRSKALPCVPLCPLWSSCSAA